MKLHQLEAVAAIAKHGSLRAAARELGASQPALTRNLAELERELGVTIFERRARGMVPTLAGAAFVLRSEIILNETRRAVEEVEQINGGGAGTLNVCLSISAHLLLLPAALKAFSRRYPLVQLNVVEGTFNEQEADLRSGRLDFYVGPQPEQKVPPELAEELMFENVRAIICRKGHPKSNASTLEELVDSEWLAITSTRGGEEDFSGLFRRHGLPQPRVRLRGRSALTLMTVLRDSDLLALVPIQWLGFDPMKDVVQAINVGETLPAPPIVAIRRRELPLTPAATHLLDLFRRKIANLDGTLGLPGPAAAPSG